MPNSRKSKPRKANTIRFVETAGNVFRDLGFDESESVNLLARAELMLTIERTIKARGLTQVEAAEIFGVGQPRVSDLFKGKIDRFTVDMLMIWVTKLGMNVTITVDDKHVA